MSSDNSKRPATKQGERRVRLLAPYTIDSNVALVGSVIDLPEREAHQLEGARRAVHSPGASPSHFINRAATKRTLSRVGPQTEAEEASGNEIDSRLNLNKADADTLVTIKGVGKKTAGDIVASREADGPFDSLEDCAERVGGVSLEQLQSANATV